MPRFAPTTSSSLSRLFPHTYWSMLMGICLRSGGGPALTTTPRMAAADAASIPGHHPASTTPMTPQATRPAPSLMRDLLVRLVRDAVGSAIGPLRSIGVRHVAVEVSEQCVHVASRIPKVQEFGLDKARVDPLLELRPERIEEAVEIEHRNGFPVIAELLEGQRLEDFFERPDPAGQSHEGLAPLVHDGLAITQPVGDHELAHLRLPHSEIEERARDYPRHLPAVRENG